MSKTNESIRNVIEKKSGNRKFKLSLESIKPDSEDWFGTPAYQLSLTLEGSPMGPLGVFCIQEDTIDQLVSEFWRRTRLLKMTAECVDFLTPEVGVSLPEGTTSETKQALLRLSRASSLGWTREEVYAWFGEQAPSIEGKPEEMQVEVMPQLIRRKVLG